MAETDTKSDDFLARVYNVGSPEDCKKLYDVWAPTYNADLNDPSQEYAAPALTAQAVGSANGRTDGTILDAGCGTGLVGVALSLAGAKSIDGIDISPEMLKIAEQTAVYKTLTVADLSKRIDKPNGSYDVVTCCGTLTQGHVGPDPALKEFVRITKKEGVIIATVLDEIWSSGGYKSEVERLRVDGLVEVMSTEVIDYRRGTATKGPLKGRMIVLRKR